MISRPRDGHDVGRDESIGSSASRRIGYGRSVTGKLGDASDRADGYSRQRDDRRGVGAADSSNVRQAASEKMEGLEHPKRKKIDRRAE